MSASLPLESVCGVVEKGFFVIGWGLTSVVRVPRFHAWQSSLLFTALFVVHLLFSWSTFLSWVFFFGDLVLIAWLVLNAYRDADTLDRSVRSCAFFQRATAVLTPPQVRGAHCWADSKQDSGR